MQALCGLRRSFLCLGVKLPAESKLRDVDMAEEMTGYYTYDVLNQASVAMLQQANNMPQSVLNLIG